VGRICGKGKFSAWSERARDRVMDGESGVSIEEVPVAGNAYVKERENESHAVICNAVPLVHVSQDGIALRFFE